MADDLSLVAQAIRRAISSDADAVSALALRAKSSWGYPQQWLQLWADDLTITGEYLARHPAFVAVNEGEPVGVCVLEIKGDDASLEHVWIAPECQKLGVGRALVARALGAARCAGVRQVDVLSDPHAEAFYLKLGARPCRDVPAPMPGAAARVLPLLRFDLVD